jgi:FtsP/CotA-like multicopper oxidase with cupredoxin domain
VNAGAESLKYFFIDGQQMTVIANDFTPIKPYNTTVVTLGIGQRADVLIQGNGKPGDSFWMRANNSYICGQTEVGEALTEVRYEKADLSKPPKLQAQPSSPTSRSRASLTPTLSSCTISTRRSTQLASKSGRSMTPRFTATTTIL